jgi:prepilin-type N-terminal cleavage/methylation domain-containing protein
MNGPKRRSPDDGFTLIELLIATSILGILVTAIVAAMLVSLGGLAGQAQAVTDTTGAQLLSSYLVTDAEGADYVNPGQLPTGDANKFTCDDGTGTRVLLELRWTDADGTTGTTDAVYRIEPTSATDYRLERRTYSVNVASKTCTQTGSTSVVSDVSSVPTDTMAVCDGGATCNNTSTIVGLQVAAFSTDPKAAARYSAYTFSVSGARRLS